VTDEFKGLIAKAATGAALSRDEAARGFDTMMSGEATPSQMGGLLMALRVRGETIEEITGAVTAMRDKMLRVRAPVDAIDVVGTGGDASGSFNISTCAAFIVAGAGVPVAKHGNRALSSRSGAADVLGALGVNIELLFSLVFGLGAVFAGLAGLMAAPLSSVKIGMGDDILIVAFVIIVIGGIGSIKGAFVAAMVVGQIDIIGRAFLPDLLKTFLSNSAASSAAPAISQVLVYIVMAGVLVWRPTGLFGQRS